ncbi:MAG: hypothetical protein WCG80_16955 [Spirochaetales bacterium]
MKQALHFIAGFLTLVVLVVLCLGMAMIIVYAFDRAAFDRSIDEMKANAIEIAQGDDE